MKHFSTTCVYINEDLAREVPGLYWNQTPCVVNCYSLLIHYIKPGTDALSGGLPLT